MIYRDFKGLRLPLLGFGAMRLPLNPDKSIDRKTTGEMIGLAMENGVNYFDTAYIYHGSESEPALGELLSDYPRDSYYLATKYPGHQIADSYDPEEIFERQLKKCRVDHFDFYLMHNFCENSYNTYTDPRWNIIPYFIEQKKNGRIRHLGFSSHSRPGHLKKILDGYADVMEFCQIQLNYLDWTLQDAAEKYDILSEYGIPVWVMEPLHGGKLANLPEKAVEELNASGRSMSPAEWGFRFVQSLPNVRMILSGMSNPDQMRDNLRIFSGEAPLNEKEKEATQKAAELLKDSLPCTGCRYCCDGCPAGLDIPLLISLLNEAKYEAHSFTVALMLDSIAEDRQPEACIGCGQCSAICPQGIDVPKAMQDFAALRDLIPNWKKISEERARAAAASKE